MNNGIKVDRGLVELLKLKAGAEDALLCAWIDAGDRPEHRVMAEGAAEAARARSLRLAGGDPTVAVVLFRAALAAARLEVA